MHHNYQLLPGEEISPPPQQPDRCTVDDAHLHMMEVAVRDAGRWAYGVKAIEVWEYTDRGRLKLAEGGSWVDPIYRQNDDPQISEALAKLFDPNTPGFCQLSEVAPGEGLCGALWTNCFGTMISSVRLTDENLKQERMNKRINWTIVRGIAEDPDQPYHDRTVVMADAGFYYAAGLPFNVRNKKGVVVFLARKSISMQKLQCVLNEEYMLSVTDHIGSILALRTPRHLSVVERKKDARAAWHRARILIKYMRMFRSARELTSGESSHLDTNNIAQEHHRKRIRETITNSLCDKFDATKLYWGTWATKMRGGDILPPRGASLWMTCFSLTVAFIAFYIMAFTNTSLKMRFGNDLGFELTQIGSLTSLVYTLSPAPSAQPRTIILGQMICMVVGMFFSQIPSGKSWTGDEFDDPMGWLRVALAVSTSCALMGYCGVAHPPGGALTVTMLDYRWTDVRSYWKFGIIILQDLLFILMGAMFNNTNPTRSYPTFWGYIPDMIFKNSEHVLESIKTKMMRRASLMSLLSDYEKREMLLEDDDVMRTEKTKPLLSDNEKSDMHLDDVLGIARLG